MVCGNACGNRCVVILCGNWRVVICVVTNPFCGKSYHMLIHSCGIPVVNWDIYHRTFPVVHSVVKSCGTFCGKVLWYILW